MHRILLFFLPVFFFALFHPTNVRADYDKECQLKFPQPGHKCANTGNTYTGLCQIVHCPKGCGDDNRCSFSDRGAYRTIEECDNANLNSGECGQIDVIDSTKKYCHPGIGYCDYKEIQCYSTCIGEPKPTKDKDVTPAPTFPVYPTPTLKPFICQNTNVTGPIAAGSTFNIETFVRATQAEVTVNLTYHVERNGTEIANSGLILALKVEGTTDLYVGRWTYTVPSDNNGSGSYKIWLEINGHPPQAFLLDKQTVQVLGQSDQKNLTELNFIIDLIMKFFNIGPTPTYAPFEPYLTPVSGLEGTMTIYRPTGVATLQLGTFNPAINIQVHCDTITFTIL
ncbi:hypothetical protein A2W14_06235 [Candidatus Gottesmanbacteria bacterium RBG_16_37_8]|uniref:Uncharacterized protein n=1 Tax=Candidatus Gottesmanbacteria bacterium RBG_16_37_8 TaxID=1798371 RepID=A0A1F5YVW2_9BACT|nr:MAG: hypothetical protein A2W14_06235 [Candidatus Gottesmanbacteria bacterium RBG_16_37_8]